jgi:Xaa-Pro aminopeptidase
MSHDWAGRIQALRPRWIASGDVCLITSLTNIRYLTGLEASAGLLVLGDGRAQLLLDGRYVTVAHELQAAHQMADASIVDVVAIDGGFEQALATQLAGRPAARVVFEPDHVTVAGLERWRGVHTAEWHGISDLVERLRLRKDAGELAILRRAGTLLSEVAGRLGEWVRAGRAERDVAADILAAGFSKPAFETIVASGPNSARPHARPGSRTLAEGDLVVLDFGGVLDGYCVDLTRMAAIGRVSPEAVELYSAVRSAHGAALKAIRAGRPARSVDGAARQVLDDKGLGGAFVHGTGHGLGLEVHEAPRLSRLSPLDEVLEAGMVCTIEPGAYVPGLGGARLEDDVVVTESGAEVLTTASTDLLISHL